MRLFSKQLLKKAWIIDHINQGLAPETAAALTKVAFEVNEVNRVEIQCDPNNMRSAAVPRKLGFVHEATLRPCVVLGGYG